jgi:hypothetical protein
MRGRWRKEIRLLIFFVSHRSSCRCNRKLSKSFPTSDSKRRHTSSIGIHAKSAGEARNKRGRVNVSSSSLRSTNRVSSGLELLSCTHRPHAMPPSSAHSSALGSFGWIAYVSGGGRRAAVVTQCRSVVQLVPLELGKDFRIPGADHVGVRVEDAALRRLFGQL